MEKHELEKLLGELFTAFVPIADSFESKPKRLNVDISNDGHSILIENKETREVVQLIRVPRNKSGDWKAKLL